MLNAAGCHIGRERVRTWITDETEAGRLPLRTFRVRRGRPPKGGAAQAPPPSAAPHPPDLRPFAEQHGIPLGNDGNLDLLRWARELGSERVSQLSKLELFLIESMEDPWREHAERWSAKWVASVVASAEVLRYEMLEAARIHELTSRSPGRIGGESPS
jgi:hypothetical protein